MFNQYVFILIWVGFMALIANNHLRYEYLQGEEVVRNTTMFAFIAIFPVIYFAGSRNWIFDTPLYIASYREMPISFGEISTFLLTRTKDKGFSILSIALKNMFYSYGGVDYRPYLMTIALFHGLSICWFFRRYSEDYVLSIFLFIASTDYISWMFNGLRQFTAVAIIILATPLMVSETRRGLFKKYIPLFVIIALASTMHQSAFLMIPIVIICQGEAWNKKTLLFICLVIMGMAFTARFTSVMESSLVGTQYENIVSDYTSWNDDGTNPLRVLVYSIPAIISFIQRNRIKEYGGHLLNFCTNMSIVSAGLYLLSMVTSGIFLGRLPIYCSLYSYILLPWELNVFTEANGRFLKSLTVTGYIAFYYFVMHFQHGLI